MKAVSSEASLTSLPYRSFAFGTQIGRLKLRTFVPAFCDVAAITLVGLRPAGAWAHASDLYPYCSVNSFAGGTNCYIASRAQHEFRELCIDNPRYLGAERARAWMRNHKPEWRWWR